MKRYADAYAVANAIIAQGEFIKTVAGIAAAAIVVAALVFGLAAAGIAPENLKGGVTFASVALGGVVAAIVWSILHGIGVLIAANGQQLLATVDIAVHTSRLMNTGEEP